MEGGARKAPNLVVVGVGIGGIWNVRCFPMDALLETLEGPLVPTSA